MLKYLIDFKSPLFKIILTTTLILWVVQLTSFSLNTSVSVIVHHVVTLEAIVLIIFGLIPWYGFKYRGLGIDDHFRKILMVATYLLLIQQLFTILGQSFFVFNLLLFVIFSLLIILNFTLLFYHFRDPSKTPPSYYGANLFLKDEFQLTKGINKNE